MSEIPYGYCHCGCGQKTENAKYSWKARGWKKGEPLRYIPGHNMGTPRVVAIGERFGRLVVKAKDGSYFLCVCDCGKENKVWRTALINGLSKSCGCLAGEKASARLLTHGNSRIGKTTLIYRVWCTMLERCSNPNNHKYKDYGGRGITVCERWRSFENFLTDMGERPEGQTIERKDNSLGYSPENCVWATRKEQARNTRRNRWITYDGKIQILEDWANEVGIDSRIIGKRLKKGWSVEDALYKKKRTCKKAPV